MTNIMTTESGLYVSSVARTVRRDSNVSSGTDQGIVSRCLDCLTVAVVIDWRAKACSGFIVSFLCRDLSG